MILGIACIIVLIVVIFENQQFKKQIDQLEEKNKKLEQIIQEYLDANEAEVFDETKFNALKSHIEGIKNRENSYQEQNNKVVENPTVERAEKIIDEQREQTINQSTVNQEKKEIDKETLKNNLILITGSIFIILAAIIFLTSTWNIVPNVVKTITLVLLIGVFLGASHIAKKIFRLEETSRTFFNIGMSYIPIAMFSITLFGLLGDYLSISGAGVNIYFSICIILLSLMYFYLATVGKLTNLYLIITSIISVPILLCTTIGISNILAIAIITAIYYLKSKNENGIISKTIYMFGIVIFVWALVNLCYFVLDITIKQAIMIIFMIGLYIYSMCTSDKLIKPVVLVTFIVMPIIYFSTVILGILGDVDFLIKDYIILWITTIMTFVAYRKIDIYKEILLPLVPIGIFLSGINTVFRCELDFSYVVVLSVIIFVISMIKPIKDTKLKEVFAKYGNILIIISMILYYIISYEKTIYNLLLHIFVFACYILAFIRNRKRIEYKILSYILSNLLLCSICYIINQTDLLQYVPFITTMAITALEIYWKNRKDYFSIAYLLVAYIITFLLLNIGISITTFLLVIISCIMFVIYIHKNQFTVNTNIIPMIAILPSIYLSKWAVVSDFNFMVLASIAVIILTTMLSIRKDKISIFTISSAIYILLQAIAFDISVYITILFVMAWAILHAIKLEKYKDCFKVIFYLAVLVLYLNVVKDIGKLFNINISQITIINYIGYIICIFTITRDILKNRMPTIYKPIEYIASAILYFVALTDYTNEIDGMIFVVFLVIISMLSYKKRYGPIFLSSIIAIIINAFILTRAFWFSIPWWIYMLVIGIILIAFAIRNEIGEIKQKELIKKKLEDFRKNIDI